MHLGNIFTFVCSLGLDWIWENWGIKVWNFGLMLEDDQNRYKITERSE